MCGAENPVDNVEVSALEASDHFGQEVRPLLGEVLSADDADGIAQLHRQEQRMRGQ